MGIRLEIGGAVYEAEEYSVQEDSTPLSSEDSSGSVGTFSFSIPKTPDTQAWRLIGKDVKLLDTRRGTTVGSVSAVSEEDYGALRVECLSRLGKLNIYDVQAQPFTGNLRDAFTYYLKLAEQNFDLLVDPTLVNKQVVFQGWSGELWLSLKQMAAALDCEIALVSNVVLLRPLRTREAVDHRNITRSRDYGNSQVSRAVEVYHYDNRPVQDVLVYPPGGWSPETETISVGSGETLEYPIELSASVSSIQQPVIQDFVLPEYDASSVFTVAGDDGLPINEAQWNAGGGSLEVVINPDTTSLTVKIVGPKGLYNTDKTEILTYQIALTAGNSSRYSTLRIVGTGVAFNKEVLRVRTMVPDNVTGTDVGITIDNPFLSTLDQAYSAGIRAARFYSGQQMSISGQMTTINQLGDNGSAAYPKYSVDQAQHQGKTYASVKTFYGTKTYGAIEQSYYDVVRDDFNNQVFGNAGGVRVWDRVSNKYYRVRASTITASTVDFDGEEDTTYADVAKGITGKTYATDKAQTPGISYAERDRMGISNV